MNKRIYNKIIKRCREKFDADNRKRRNMSEKEINSILTGLEKKTWKRESDIQCKIADQIIEELKVEGKWD
jgi:hypothetical protein